ncbi:hypothetical protein [Nonomuraea coxensis]|uniref:hypothetical protein n=1 Tax=Nonomuraea coxensis TaxID=404386 RepID=UPI0012F76E03|nr:hypothetical protein [Nonomuraea coxensis]
MPDPGLGLVPGPVADPPPGLGAALTAGLVPAGWSVPAASRWWAVAHSAVAMTTAAATRAATRLAPVLM